MKSSSLLHLLVMFAGVILAGTPGFGQQGSEDIVLTWNDLAIKTASSNDSGALLMVRALATMHTAMFDAWAQFDAVAVPTMGDLARRPEAERTVANKREAISYAAFRVLTDLFPADTLNLKREVTNHGYDPKKEFRDRTTPSGIGLLAADRIVEYRHHDGANQLGDLHPGAYSDYTGYATINSPDIIRDPDRWQPLSGANRNSSTQRFYMPQWGRVQPFGFESPMDVRPQAAPKTLRSDPSGYILQAKDLVELTNDLTDRQKVIAEYWEFSQGQGTNFILWNQFARFAAQRRELGLNSPRKNS